jgi:hypothetical protein
MSHDDHECDDNHRLGDHINFTAAEIVVMQEQIKKAADALAKTLVELEKTTVNAVDMMTAFHDAFGPMNYVMTVADNKAHSVIADLVKGHLHGDD